MKSNNLSIKIRLSKDLWKFKRKPEILMKKFKVRNKRQSPVCQNGGYVSAYR